MRPVPGYEIAVGHTLTNGEVTGSLERKQVGLERTWIVFVQILFAEETPPRLVICPKGAELAHPEYR
jgi:hypothetical protein